MRGIALALGGPPDAFEGDRAGDSFWVMRLIGYPVLSDIPELQRTETGWYCSYVIQLPFWLLFKFKFVDCKFLCFFFFPFPCISIIRKCSGAHTDYGKMISDKGYITIVMPYFVV